MELRVDKQLIFACPMQLQLCLRQIRTTKSLEVKQLPDKQQDNHQTVKTKKKINQVDIQKSLTYNKFYIFVAKLILLHENTNLNLQKVSITHCMRYYVFALAMQNYGHYLNGLLPLPILKMNSSQKYLCLGKRWLYPRCIVLR